MISNFLILILIGFVCNSFSSNEQSTVTNQERNLFAGYEIIGEVKTLKLDGKYQARWVKIILMIID